MAKDTSKLSVETLTHDDATRKNIPTAEYQSVMAKDEQSPIRLAYERRNRDLDPQLVWRGKDEQDWSDLVVHAPPLYIQEKVHPKVLIDDLLRRTESQQPAEPDQIDLFSDFNGLPNDNAKTEFYRHDAHWTNRMILGDSLQVMASLAEREGLRGKVQCIYFDPPYGIKFNSNFQWSTTSNQVKDGNVEHITREPEQVKAFRDTWRDGIHSYLTYLRDRLTVARDLLSDSGSIFVQIGDENLHRVKSVLDEVFGSDNAGPTIAFKTTAGLASDFLAGSTDHLIWYFKSKPQAKFRRIFNKKIPGEEGATQFNLIQSPDISVIRRFDESSDSKLLNEGWSRLAHDNITSTGFATTTNYNLDFQGKSFKLPSANIRWKTPPEGMSRLKKASRVMLVGSTPRYKRLLEDFSIYPIVDLWTDTGISGFSDKKFFVVQTNPKVIERCIQMTTDPGDLVLDPTCGSGTTAYVAEQWGRRWITLDTSRVALALARARIMGARYPFYMLADSYEGQRKEAEVTRAMPSTQITRNDIRQGFVYERVPHITLKAIANNAEIDVIWDKFQEKLEPLREQLNQTLDKQWQEWEIPRDADANWSDAVKKLHADWWQQRIARQQEIDASIAAKADSEYLFDKPYEDKKKVRVAGPFTVESLSPHRVLTVDENDDLVDGVAESNAEYREERDFVQMILENLKTAGVQQAHKTDKIDFTALSPWPGELICAEGRYWEGSESTGAEKRAAIFIGPEFGTVSRPDLVAAAREAGDAGFDVLIACAFNYDAHSSEFDKLGRIPVLKARMNADLHMADDLKNTGKGNLFVIFGEPDIDILDAEDGKIQVKVNGVDVFHPNTGEVRSDGAEGIACWFIDTDYNEESFFVRHAYFLGANDPYKALKTTLKAEINEEAWATLNSDTSRPFDKPKSGRIAVKVINHLGDEVMKVFRVG
ncbi:site-specific DNA-methyltransferase [Methylococcaceae bacterium WWC4]|nr:site-specific DNA-methyltransferase [Methylococcaceae bacterium WWC4]